jgi:hypothetical protein
MALAKSMELDKDNLVSKKDQKALGDLKIVDSLVRKNIEAGTYDKAVTNLSALLESCPMSIDRVCLKIECLCKSFQFDEANKYSAELMKKDKFSSNPKVLLWRGKVLCYTGADVMGKKHFTQALQFDPDLKECQISMK